MDKFKIYRAQFSSNDYDEFATIFTVACIEEKLLEPGIFKGEVKIVQSQNVIINNFLLNKKILQIGTGIPGYITFAIWNPGTFFTWKKHEMNKGMIGVIWGNEHQSVTGSGFTGIPISIKDDFFTRICHLKGHSYLIDKLNNIEVLRVSEIKLSEIRQLLNFIVLNTNLQERSLFDLLESQLIDKLINCLAESFPDNAYSDSTHDKFSNVIDYIHDNLSELTSVRQICENTNVSERTLRRLMHKKCNTSPKFYLNKLRLNEVRKGLKRKTESNIRQIANDFNFWHMGQFTKDYKTLFGELPSKTYNSFNSNTK